MSPPFDAADESAAPPFMDFTYSSPAFTALVTAFVVMVAPDRASISSSTVAPDLVYWNLSTFLPANCDLKLSVSASIPSPAVSESDRNEIPFVVPSALTPMAS